MKHRPLIAIALVAVVTVYAATGQDRYASYRESDDGMNVARESVIAIKVALKSRYSANFEDMSLRDAFDRISEDFQISILFDQKALSEEGVSTDQGITLKTNRNSLKNTLRLMLEPISLAMVIEDGVLKITTATESQKKRIVRIYPVRDLVASLESTNPDESATSQDYRELMNAVMRTVQGDHVKWEAMDGEGGSMTPVPRVGAIVILQTQRTHEEIDQLLTALRKGKQLQRVPWIGVSPDDFDDSELYKAESRRSGSKASRY